MVLAHASSSRLLFRRKRSLGGTVISAAALAAMGLLPVMAPGPLTTARAALAMTLFGLTAVLFMLDRRRVERVSVALDRGALETSQGAVAISRARFIALSSTGSSEERAARGRYQAELVLDGGARVVLLERSDPALVIADLRRVLRHWSLPVRSGWGLPDTADPWNGTKPAACVPHQTVSQSGRPFANERGAGLCVVGGFLVIATAMAVMHVSRIERGAPTSLLSWALSATTLLFVLLLGVFLLSDRVAARGGPDGLRLERRGLGLRLRALDLPWERIRGVWAVGVDANVPQHLLVDLGDELVAFPFAGEAARAFTRALAS